MVTRRRIAILSVVIALALLLMFSNALHGLVEHALATSAAIIAGHPRLGLAVFVLWSIASAMLAFVSTAVVVPIAVYTWGAPTTVILLWLSWLCGGSIAYVIGRTLGRRVATWFVSADKLEYYTRRISKTASFLTIILFQLAVPSELPGYVLGAARYRFSIYFIALSLSELPFAIGAVYLSEGFIRRDYVVLAGVAAAALAVSAITFEVFHRRLRRSAGESDDLTATQSQPTTPAR